MFSSILSGSCDFVHPESWYLSSIWWKSTFKVQWNHLPSRNFHLLFLMLTWKFSLDQSFDDLPSGKFLEIGRIEEVRLFSSLILSSNSDFSFDWRWSLVRLHVPLQSPFVSPFHGSADDIIENSNDCAGWTELFQKYIRLSRSYRLRLDSGALSYWVCPLFFRTNSRPFLNLVEIFDICSADYLSVSMVLAALSTLNRSRLHSGSCSLWSVELPDTQASHDSVSTWGFSSRKCPRALCAVPIESTFEGGDLRTLNLSFNLLSSHS